MHEVDEPGLTMAFDVLRFAPAEVVVDDDKMAGAAPQAVPNYPI